MSRKIIVFKPYNPERNPLNMPPLKRCLDSTRFRLKWFSWFFLFPTLVFNSLAQTCVPPSSGLVGWWRAENAAVDEAGFNNGAFIGNVQFETGKVGEAFVFNGNGAAVGLGFASALQLQDFTIEAWIRRSSTNAATLNNSNGNGHIFAFDSGGYTLFMRNSGFLALSKTAIDFVQSTNAILDTNYHHIAVTKEGAAVAFFIDGIRYPAPDYETEFTFTTSASIGGIGSAFSFLGAIDELAIYNRPLSTEEIQAIYTAGSVGKCITFVSPSVVAQPENQTVNVGQTAFFAVSANGTTPLKYQWRFNDTNLIQSATNSVLVLTNVQLSQAGNYSVEVANGIGTNVSFNGVLTVNPAPDCAGIPAGLVSWWHADGTAQDEAGGNNGTNSSNVYYAIGKSGQRFVFDGNGSVVQLGSAVNLRLQNFTIESWIRRSSMESTTLNNPNGHGHIFAYGSGGYTLFMRPGGNLALSKTGVDYVDSSAAITDTNYHHIAVTKTNSLIVFYIDGTAYPADSYDPGFTFTTTASIGGIGSTYSFLGDIDELAIYNRALSSTEIQSIYQADSTGKCPTSIVPSFVTQPVNQSVRKGNTATFTVSSAGTPQLIYQWKFNGTDIADATSNVLVLTNVQLSSTGSYSVQITNAFGAVSSSNATLSVTFPPANIRINAVTEMSGRTISVPVLLAANGNENALSFSLSFNTNWFVFSSVTLGTNAQDASILLNTSQANIGRVGVAIGLMTGTFSEGTQQVARINLQTKVSVQGSPILTGISFFDLPLQRELLDSQGSALAATYTGATMVLTQADLEGDVFPRPTGSRSLNISDWQQIGRFVAGLDTAASGTELQRADCAPRDSFGDGQLKVTDWVQAGRYAAALDILTAINGPTNEITPVPMVGAGSREFNLSTADVTQGLTAMTSVNLYSQGNENAIALSITFNPTALNYSSSALGSAASGATLIVNTNMLRMGKVGFLLSLPTGTAFAAGSQEVLKINFTTLTSGTQPVNFADQPIARGTSDALANELSAVYNENAVLVKSPPVLNIVQSQTNIILTWPTTEMGFYLQSATNFTEWSNVVGTVQTNGGEATITLPIKTETRFFRLTGQ